MRQREKGLGVLFFVVPPCPPSQPIDEPHRGLVNIHIKIMHNVSEGSKGGISGCTGLICAEPSGVGSRRRSIAERWWPEALPHAVTDSVSSLQGLGQSCVCICSLSRVTGLLRSEGRHPNRLSIHHLLWSACLGASFCNCLVSSRPG